MPSSSTPRRESSLEAPIRKPVFVIASLGITIVAITSIGAVTAADTAANLLALIDTWLRAGWAPLIFLLASFGFGRVFIRMISCDTKPSHARAVVQLTLGLALMLSGIHGLGVLGFLNPVTAIGVAVIGSGLALHQGFKQSPLGVRTKPKALKVPLMSFLLVIPLAIGIVAVASPPGWLWDSEFGGFDALSYHLQLPQEWLRLGRLTPLEHNVYSFLPSYMESASVFLAHLTLAPIDSASGHGLTAGTGWRAMMPQTLHLLITIAAAWAVGQFASEITRRYQDQEPAEKNDRAGAFAGWTAAAITLATPWVLVVGTLAYNEMAVVLLGAGALLLAMDREIKPTTRSVLCAFLVGVACGCKPTAILFVAPPVGILLIAGLPRKNLMPVVGLGLLVGVLTLSPWLIRNAVASGNPVFPAMAGLFGSGHYDLSEIARYTDAHTFHGSVLDRLRLLLWTDPATDANALAVQRFRGVANPQWSLLWPAGVLGIGLLCVRARTRGIGLLLAGALLSQLVAWVFFTHLQSRFLLPSVVILAPSVGAAFAFGVRSYSAIPFVSVCGVVLLTLAQTGMSVVNFSHQRGGAGGGPNLRLPMGPSLDLGRPYDPELGEAIPSAYVNAELPASAVVYLLGDSTPFYFDRPVVYNTTYDPWPLGEAIAANPDSPDAWTRSLLDRGITHVLIAWPELGRLTAAGWIDPSITASRVSAWVSTLGPPMQTWPNRSALPSRALYRLSTAEEPEL